MSSPEPIKFTDGDAYERFMTPWSRSAGAVFLDWIAQKPGLTWADIGCGNGAFTELIVQKAAPASVSAIDPSDAQIKSARQKLPGKPIEWLTGDAMALPYADGRFDVSVMALVLFFVPDARKGAQELARVTRPGGTVASYTWDVTRGGAPFNPVWEELRDLGRAPVSPPSADASRLENLKALWAAIGLVDVETREIVVDRTFVDIEDYWQCMVLSSPRAIVDKLPPAEIEQLKQRLRARLPTASNGEITVHACATAIKGRTPG